MKLIEYIKEVDYISFNTLWEVQQQFIDIKKMYDSNIKVEVVDGMFDFNTTFYVKGVDFVFNAKEVEDGSYVIGFHRKGELHDLFKSRAEKKYIGDVISGVFRSLKRLIDTNNVNEFMFNTTEVELIKFYDKLSKYVEKRFNFKLKERVNIKGVIVWRYEKN